MFQAIPSLFLPWLFITIVSVIIELVLLIFIIQDEKVVLDQPYPNHTHTLFYFSISDFIFSCCSFCDVSRCCCSYYSGVTHLLYFIYDLVLQVYSFICIFCMYKECKKGIRSSTYSQPVISYWIFTK